MSGQEQKKQEPIGAELEQLPIEELEKLLSVKQRRFVLELDKDGNATQAAIRAGYKPGVNNASAAVAGSRLLRNDNVLAYRRARAREQYEVLGINEDSLARRIFEVYARCIQAEAVLKWDYDLHQYVETGQYVFDSKGALKALELLGQTVSMFESNVNLNAAGIEEYLKRLEQPVSY